jgi:hypothetical protein
MSTPSDLCKFIETLFAGKLMSSASFTSMKTIESNMGHGIFQIPFNTKRGYGHNGGIDGFQSVLAYFPDDSLALCILGNAFDYPLNDISIGVLSLYYHQPYVIPSFEKKVVSGDAAKTCEGVYSNSSINMKITISKNDETLMAQASGQSAFPLEKVSELEYKFDAAKIQIKFSKDANGNILSFNLKQSGADLKFEKE